MASIGANKTSADQALALKANKAVRMIAGAGLSGGGDLSADRTIALATPSTLNGSTTNWVGNGSTGHTHELAKATPTLAGVVKLVGALDSAATDAALSAEMGKKLQDEKLPKTDLKFTRPLVASASEDVNLDLSSRKSIIDNMGLSYINNGHMQAVYHNSEAKHNITNLPLSVKSPIQLDFYLMGGFSFIDCHYVLLNRSFRSRINWNNDTFVLDWKENLNDKNGVTLSGNQTIGGLKTYTNHQSFSDGLRVSVPTKESWAVLAVDNTGVYLSNPESNKHLKLNDNGILQYGGEKVFTYYDRSDSYTLDDTSKIATSRAVKLLNDASASASTSITAGNGLSGGGTLAASRTITLGTPSTITASTTNSVSASSHTHNIDNASTAVAGVVKLNDTLSSMSTTEALTANQGRVLNNSIAGKADKASTLAGYGLSDAVSVLTGTISDGGTIPLPAGFVESQCKWMVSMSSDNPGGIAWDINEDTSRVHYRFECFSTGRVVTAKAYRQWQGGNIDSVSGRANYIIIGVK